MKSKLTTDAKRSQVGFSLLELVVVIAIFGLVLTSAYQILVSTLQADERVNEVTRSGKIGEAILSQIRRDLQGTIWRGFGNDVFQVEDNGTGETASDAIHFLTTAPVPPAPVDYADEWSGEVASVGYVTRSGPDGQLILFRRVKWLTADDPFEGTNYYPVYERLKAISFEALDVGAEWQEDWDSEDRVDPNTGNNHETEIERLAGEVPEDDGDDDDDLTVDPEDEVEPPPVVPIAIRVQLHVYVGDEKGLYKDRNGEPLVEIYTAVVGILSGESLALDPEVADLLPDETGTTTPTTEDPPGGDSPTVPTPGR